MFEGGDRKLGKISTKNWKAVATNYNLARKKPCVLPQPWTIIFTKRKVNVKRSKVPTLLTGSPKPSLKSSSLPPDHPER